jgi:pyridoxamine 5'-phosphate oxidase-like protein
MLAAMARIGHDPIAKFIRWLDDARRVRIPNYEAMALATAARGGKTSVRFVLLKGIDERGFVFFTDARSRKGRELRGNPHASLAPRNLARRDPRVLDVSLLGGFFCSERPETGISVVVTSSLTPPPRWGG